MLGNLLPCQPAHNIPVFPCVMNELLHSQRHGEQANCQIADCHVDDKEIARGPGLGIPDDDVADAEVTDDAQYHEQSETNPTKRKSHFKPLIN